MLRSSLRPLAVLAAALLLGAQAWLVTLRLLLDPRRTGWAAEGPSGIPPNARAMAERWLRVWEDPGRREREILAARAGNPEWDLMARTFLVLSFANMSLRDRGLEPRCLAAMDRIIEATLRAERERGVHHFLMAYSRRGRFQASPPRSLFVDGELALMLAARRLVREEPRYRALLRERVDSMSGRMRASPVASAESYPGEAWTFCNTAALAAIRMADVLDGTDHRPLLHGWVWSAMERLTHRPTGLLVSSYDLSGGPKDGPEGSSAWMAAHFLQLVDADVAREQYARARSELGRRLQGFAWALEWPASWRGREDVDSGPVVPLLGASAGSSGLALVAAGAFGDAGFKDDLLASLELSAFPRARGPERRYLASNAAGDAVILYAAVQGPLWEKVRSGAVRGHGI